MYNRQFLQLGHNEIEATILAMPRNYTSFDFCLEFERNHWQTREAFIEIYMHRRHDRRHAIQIVHSQLMHTVNKCFHHLTRKVRTIPNPNGGDMSDWVRD